MAAQLHNVCNWPKKPDNLIFDAIQKNEIGRGSYGVVYSGKLDGRPVAVKKIHSVLFQAPENDRLLREFEKECDILKSLQHPNIVKLLGTFRDDGDGREPLLVMEVYKENLKEYLSRNKGKLSVSRQLEIAKEVTEGLCFLHRNNIVHRDLKLENILVGEDGHVRIGDFGQSKLLGDIGEDMKTTQPGTVRYMPPEALKGGTTYKANIDVFSLGVVFNCIATQCEPTTGIMGIGHEVELKRRAKDLQAMAEHHPLELLIRVCLQDDPVIRPDVFMVHFNLNLLVCSSDYPELQRKFEENKQLLAKSERELKKREYSEHMLKMQTEKLTRDLGKRVDSELKLKKLTNTLSRQLDCIGKEKAALQGTLEKKEDSELQLKKQTEQLRSQLDRMIMEMKELQHQLDGMRKKNTVLQRELKVRESSERELKKQNEKLTRQLYCMGKEKTGLQRELKVRESSERELKRQTEELTKELKDTRQSKMDMQQELEKQTERLKSLQEMIHTEANLQRQSITKVLEFLDNNSEGNSPEIETHDRKEGKKPDEDKKQTQEE